MIFSEVFQTGLTIDVLMMLACSRSGVGKGQILPPRYHHFLFTGRCCNHPCFALSAHQVSLATTKRV